MMRMEWTLLLASCVGGGPPPPVPCEQDGLACGQGGVCELGRCEPLNATCATHADCEDFDECTKTQCVGRVCVVAPLDDVSCSRDGEGAQGICRDGRCLEPMPFTCARDEDCAEPKGSCVHRDCVENLCVATAQPDATACELTTGLEGQCLAGACRVPRVMPSEQLRRCRHTTIRKPQADGSLVLIPKRICRDRPALHLEASARDKARQGLITTIVNILDVKPHIVLIPMADGGYRALVRFDVDGPPVDVALISMIVAHQAEKDGWRLRVVEVWGEHGGWSIVLPEPDMASPGQLTLSNYPWFRSGMQPASSGIESSR